MATAGMSVEEINTGHCQGCPGLTRGHDIPGVVAFPLRVRGCFTCRRTRSLLKPHEGLFILQTGSHTINEVFAYFTTSQQN